MSSAGENIKIDEISCPKCKHSFKLDDAISSTLVENIKKGLKASQSNIHKNELERVKKEALEEGKNETFDQIRLKEEKIKELELKMIDHQSTLKKVESKAKEEFLKEFSITQKKILDEKDDLDSKLAEFKLKNLQYQSQIESFNKVKQNEIELAVLKEKQKIETQENMRVVEKDQLIDMLRKNISELETRANQGSVQQQGEVGELLIEKSLRESFNTDEVKEVKKGAEGADCVLHVRNNRGIEVGTIYYESKRTKNFSKGWIAKIKKDLLRDKMTIGVIVTEKMPKEFSSASEVEGIWVCGFHEYLTITKVLRQLLFDVYKTKSVEDQKGDKAILMYNYINSPEFKHNLESIVLPIKKMKDQLESEKRAFLRQWSERDKLIDSVFNGAATMLGGISGISDQKLPVIEGIDDMESLLISSDNNVD